MQAHVRHHASIVLKSGYGYWLNLCLNSEVIIADECTPRKRFVVLWLDEGYRSTTSAALVIYEEYYIEGHTVPLIRENLNKLKNMVIARMNGELLQVCHTKTFA